MTATFPDSGAPEQASRRGTRRSGRRRRPRVTIVGVIGELLITAGVLVLLFLGWQLWWNDLVTANAQTDAATEISQQWIKAAPVAPVEPVSPDPVDYGEPIIAAPAVDGEAFAVLYVPRFGTDYHRTIAGGTGTSVLNSMRLGVGHYLDTQMPGEVGNFAVAAHRSAYGGALHLINELQLGDSIYVQTADGYYTYTFRDLEYVQPTQVDVIAAVPHQPGATPTDRLITLTSCNPLYSTAERIIAYGVFEGWQPLEAGPPAELAPIIAAQAQD
ncbi:class E sortase [Leifsonia sp. A12D58]|uniref:class E sortase n=1 Tax=Leifsonia sp. A12D58 TaxID=3397674 RepID=UPI0039E17830